MSKAGKSAPERVEDVLAPSVPAGRGSGRRLRGAIAHYLGTAIVSGRIEPGARLTGEVENAEALNVSRSAKGLVASKPKDGTRVLPRSNWNLLDPMVLAWAFAGEPDPQFVRDLFELRALVEPAVERCRPRGDETGRDAVDIRSQHCPGDAGDVDCELVERDHFSEGEASVDSDVARSRSRIRKLKLRGKAQYAIERAVHAGGTGHKRAPRYGVTACGHGAKS